MCGKITALGMCEMGTKHNKYVLNKAQLEMAAELANPDNQLSVSDLCVKQGVSRTTFYKWLKIPTFVDYLNGLIDSFTESELSSVWKALIRRAKKEDVSAIKLFFEMKGKYGDAAKSANPDKPQELPTLIVEEVPYDDDLKAIIDGDK